MQKSKIWLIWSNVESLHFLTPLYPVRLWAHVDSTAKTQQDQSIYFAVTSLQIQKSRVSTSSASVSCRSDLVLILCFPRIPVTKYQSTRFDKLLSLFNFKYIYDTYLNQDSGLRKVIWTQVVFLPPNFKTSEVLISSQRQTSLDSSPFSGPKFPSSSISLQLQLEATSQRILSHTSQPKTIQTNLTIPIRI